MAVTFQDEYTVYGAGGDHKCGVIEFHGDGWWCFRSSADTNHGADELRAIADKLDALEQRDKAASQ